jgi:type I restriction enzyme, S subunit
MPDAITLDEACLQVVDCEHKTAPVAAFGRQYGYSIGTPNIRNGRLLIDSAKQVDRDTFNMWTVRAIPQKYDIILTREAPVGEAALLDGMNPVCLGQRTVLLRPDSQKIVPRYLHYRLLGPELQERMYAQAEGSTVAHLNVLAIRGLILGRLPGLAEQRSIAEALGALDDKIAVNDRITSTSSGLITTLYAYALVQPGSASVPLADVVDFDFGLPFSSKSFNNNQQGLPLLRIRDFKTFVPQVWTTERLAKDVLVQPGDVVAGMDAEFRPSFWLGEPVLLNQRVLRGRSRIAGGGGAFVREVLTRPFSDIEHHKTGTTVIHLNKRDIDSCSVTVPSLDALQIFEGKADPLRRRLIAAVHESAMLAKLRDALLPRLMSGEIQVRDAEKVVADAT